MYTYASSSCLNMNWGQVLKKSVRPLIDKSLSRL